MTAFLADENFPKTSSDLLRQAGYNVASIVDSNPGAPDEIIFSIAITENRIIITFDRDFGDLVFNQRKGFPAGVIYLRLGQFRPDETAEMILQHLSDSASKFDGSFSVISRNGIRQRTP